MRIVTWNLEGRWTHDHQRTLIDLAADMLLLTEVNARASVDDFVGHFSSSLAIGSTHWSAILSRLPIVPLADPHPASVVVDVDGFLVCSSVLPWPLSGAVRPWIGANHVDRLTGTLQPIRDALVGRESIWGGDWNQPLTGSLRGFARASQALIAETVQGLGMVVPTTDLPGRTFEQRSIDHIAVPSGWLVLGAGSHPVPRDLSDHDAY